MQNHDLRVAIESVIATSKDWGEVKNRVINAYGADLLTLAKEIAIQKRGEDFYHEYEYEAYRRQTNIKSNERLSRQLSPIEEKRRHEIFMSWFNSWQTKNVTTQKGNDTLIYDVMYKLGAIYKKSSNKILLVLGVFIMAGIYWGYYSPLQYENLKTWQLNTKDNLQMSFYAKTKLVNKTMYLSIQTDSYPSYLDYSSYPISNKDGYFTVTFEDKDGFQLFSHSMQIRAFNTLVDSSDKKIGLSAQIESELPLEKYKRFDRLMISWSGLVTVIPPAPTKTEKELVPKDNSANSIDHCAPNLSKSERIRRMALKGKVREVGDREFEGADNSRLRLTWDDKVAQCW